MLDLGINEIGQVPEAQLPNCIVHNYLFWLPDKCQEDKCQTSKLLAWNPRLVWWRGRDLTEDFSTRWAALSSGLVRGRG